MRISDWSSDVCSSDLRVGNRRRVHVSDARTVQAAAQGPGFLCFLARPWQECSRYIVGEDPHRHGSPFAGKGVWPAEWRAIVEAGVVVGVASYYGWCDEATRSAEHTSELQSLMRISYAVFCLKQKNRQKYT